MKTLSIVVPVLLLCLVGCSGQNDPRAIPAATTAVPPPSSSVAAPVQPAPVQPPPTAALPPTPKSLPDNGTFKVGADIQPGEYVVSPTASHGYWERLSCLTGDFECILANGIVQGDGYLTILPGDVAVTVQNVRLTPSANPAGTGAPPPQSSGTDGQGFVGVSGARCNSSNPAVALGRTTQSLVVICETGVGRLYYKGVRLSDGASVEIDDPVRTNTGFAVTNAGVQYSLSPEALVITEGSNQLASEPMLEYWAE